ncbi:hypothetical protein K1T71_008860 [Dendrolimus kikuchii]|uniref:Uncharacterized protein n=1 Tax=Dendrolimus kikuchii TaxID=765133 RepID=A0ACC1CVT7_9NEOP|nr:hypothetical protein K1T71_008860 [Dendrolimus kikuchii]
MPRINIGYFLSRKMGYLNTISIFAGLLCLRNVHVVVPEAAERGSRVEMKCLFDLENEDLYSVKWYRGDREFCRYSPRDVPPLKVFRIPGIDVDRDSTEAQRLIFVPTTQTASGRYTCEVSADAPSFQTAMVNTHMYVVVLPKEGPSLTGLKRRYRPGMRLKVDCVSYNSIPAANLSFFINSERAISQHVTHRVDGESVNGPMSAYSTIQFYVQKHHFVEGKIRIRCTASIYSIYSQSYEKSAEQERMPTTPSSLDNIHEALVYNINRQPENNGIGPAGLLNILSLIILLLPTALR